MSEDPYRVFVVHFKQGGTFQFIARRYTLAFTGHRSNRSGRIFEVYDYADPSPRVETIDVDEIGAITSRPWEP